MTSKKRPTTKKKPAAKKAAPKSRKAAPAAVRSLRLAKETRPFRSTTLTRETLYWVILGVVVVAFGAWIMKLQEEIQGIYDSIEANSSSMVLPLEEKDAPKYRKD